MNINKNRAIGVLCALAAGTLSALAGPGDEALKALKEGNERFVAGTTKHPHSGIDRVNDTGANGQKPQVTILGCSDSRVPPERIFDVGIGDVFVIRVAGNVADTDEIGTTEYGTAHLGSPLVVVLGHTKCGAITAVATGAQVHGSLPGLVDNIIPAVESAKKKHPGVTGKDLVPFAIDENVFQSIRDLLTRSDEVRDLVKEGKLEIVGAVYDIDTGKVRWLGAHPEQAALLAATPEAPKPAKQDSHGGADNAAPEAQHKKDAHESVGHDAKAAAKAPEHGAPAEKAPKKAASAAANASALASTGSFAAPEFKGPPRSAFGPRAGKTPEISSLKPATLDRGLFFYAFATMSGLALLVTAGACFSLARTTKPDGTAGRTLTLGAKLTGGFGAVIIGILSLAAMSAHNGTQVANAVATANYFDEQNGLIAGLDADGLLMRIGVNGFLVSSSDEDLERYSDAAASCARRLELARESLKQPKRVEMLGEISRSFEEYERKFAEVVTLIDQRNGLIESQMNPTAIRVNELLEEVAKAARADGDDELSYDAGQINEEFQQARISLFKYLRKGEEKLLKEALGHAKEVRQRTGELEAKAANPACKAWIAEAGQGAAFYVSLLEQAEAIQRQRDLLVREGVEKAGDAMTRVNADLATSLSSSKAEMSEKASRVAANSEQQTAIVSIIVAVLGGLVSVTLVRSITRPLARVVSALQRISDSDLTSPALAMDGHDEIATLGQASDRMKGVLTKIMKEISSTTNEVAAAATEIAASAEQMSQGMTRQQEQTQQVAAAVEEMSVSVAEVAKKSSSAADAASESGKQAQHGGDVVGQTVQEIKGISMQVTESARAVGSLGQKSEQIGQIIGMINEIAEQTNLLALNAAIEAARAGEHGRGFAVVADEVRKLAERTTQATTQVSSSIKEIQNETKSAVERIEGGEKQVSVGVELAGNAGKALEQIVASSRSVENMVREIAMASGEQSNATRQIAQTVEQITVVTRESADGSTQAAMAASQLSERAEALRQLVGRFKV